MSAAVGTPMAMPQRIWRVAAIALGLAILAIGAIYWRAVVGAWQVWVGSTAYNHCFLVIPIAFYMGWARRRWLAGLVPQTEWRALGAIALLSLIWLAGAIVGVLEIRQFVILTMLQATALSVLGWPVYRRLIAPFLYLYFLVPTGEFLVPALQDFTAQFASYGLWLVGIPVYTNGTVIEVPSGTFAVAEACAGLRFLIAAVAFGVFYACEVYVGTRKRLIFIAISFVLPIVANGFRAFGLIAASEAFGSATAVMADHIIYGWVFFSMVLVALIYIGHFFSDRDPFSERAALSDAAAEPATPVGLRNIVVVAIAAIALAGLGPALGAILDARTGLPLPMAPPPLESGWHQSDRSTDWKPKVVRPDRVFADTVEDGTHRIDRFIALYAPHGLSSNLIRADNRVADPELWRPVFGGRRVVDVAGRPTEVNVSEVVAAGRRRVIWSFYVLDGTTAASVWQAKWHEAHAYVVGWRCPASFVAVSEEYEMGLPNAEGLARYLKTMPPLRAYVCGRNS